MRIGAGGLAIAGILALFSACSNDAPPGIRPAQPQFADTSLPPDPVDHRIYADVDPITNAIWLEWKAQAPDSTSGYQIFRAEDSTLGADGLLAHKVQIAQIESANQLIDPLPNTFRDTLNVQIGAIYWYQIRAFYRSPTNDIAYSAPSAVDISTSFHYEPRVVPMSPSGAVTLAAEGLKFIWDDPAKGGTFQIIVERIDSSGVVWSGYPLQDYGATISESYPGYATPLVRGGVYQWRVKRVDTYGGSSSQWTQFSISN